MTSVTPHDRRLSSVSLCTIAIAAAIALYGCATPRNVDVETANRDGAAGNSGRDGSSDRGTATGGAPGTGNGGQSDAGPHSGGASGDDKDADPESDATPSTDVPIAPDTNGSQRPDVPAAVDLAPGIDTRPPCLLNETRCTGATLEICDGAGKWSKKTDCPFLCQAGVCAGSCRPEDKQCGANHTPETCSTAGEWMPGTRCPFVCSGKGVCSGSCTPGIKRCSGPGSLSPEICDENGTWKSNGAACPNLCSNGTCGGSCPPGNMQCGANQTPETCSDRGTWEPNTRCRFVCTGAGNCGGQCEPGALTCSGTTARSCDVNGQWKDTPCPFACTAGRCTGNCATNGQKDCSGNDVRECRGNTWSVVQSCSTRCQAGACTACLRGTTRCEGDNLLTCRNDESGFDSKACGAPSCDPARRACNVCKPNAQRCEGTSQFTCNEQGTAEVEEKCKCGGAECSPGQTVNCGTGGCAVPRTCLPTCKFAEPCTIKTVKDEWTASVYPGGLTETSRPWSWIHGDASVAGNALALSKDDIIRREPLEGGYVLSFDVLPGVDFAAHIALGADAPYPGLYREGTGPNRDKPGPIKLGGMKYGFTESFQNFGSWIKQETLDGRITIYVKRSGEVAAISRFGPLRTGWVKYPATNPSLLHLVGSNGNITGNDGKVSAIVGCQGLTDVQVDAQYNAGKMH
jgi:hypothetical protein